MNCNVKEISKIVTQLISDIAKDEGETRVTRLVWEHNKIDIMDANSELLELPSHYAQRSLHIRFC